MNDELISYIGLGSNLGDSRMLIAQAMESLARRTTGPTRCSSLWRSTPVDCPPGSGMFINAVMEIRHRPGVTPEHFLAELQAMERSFGRGPKTVTNESRPLDLDILSWGNLVRSSPELILPHPRAHQRRFVLAPWAEIAPQLKLPGHAFTIMEYLEGLGEQGECVMVAAK